MTAREEYENRWQDHYAETEVFLNDRGELDPLGAAYVEWSGANHIFDELLERIEELTAENTDLRTSLDAKGFIARWQEAENMGYQCGRSHAERDLFIAEKQAEAEKQRADEADTQLMFRTEQRDDLLKRLAEADEKLQCVGHTKPCYYCDEPCNSLSANPSLWPIPLCHRDEPGVVKWHHVGCVSERLEKLAQAEQRVRDLESALRGREQSCAVLEEKLAQAEAAPVMRNVEVLEYASKLAAAEAQRDQARAEVHKAIDDRFRALDIARARGKQRDEYQRLYAAAEERVKWWKEYANETEDVARWAIDREREDLAGAEQRVRELEARLCRTCGKWSPYPVQEAFGPRCGTCAEGVSDNGDTSDDFGCTYWIARLTAPEPKE